MNKDSRIYIAGHSGLVGNAILKKLQSEGYSNIITKSHKELDLTDPYETKCFFRNYKPEYVFLCAAKVSGIKGNNDFPVEHFLENIKIGTNVIENSYEFDVKKLMVLGSSCIYPKESYNPIKEYSLLSGYLEITNEMYALAKISTIRLCQAYNRQYNTNYISIMPCSLYGGKESYHPENSHFMPAILQRLYNAKINNIEEVVIWGSGNPKREMMHVNDFADSALFLMNNYDSNELINVGVGSDESIANIVKKMKSIVGYEGKLVYDRTKPDGTMNKVLDVSKIKALGWKSKIDLNTGIKMMYDYFLKEIVGI